YKRKGGLMFYYIWNGSLVLITIGLPIVLMIASNGARPTFMSCREMRARYGTPQKKPKDNNSA
ncbi:hypothetical protein OFN62_39425, partial [Escherichia coli]|nr:hypothetical protein [Escherichia coli]